MVGSDGCCKQNLVISFQLVKFRRAVNIAVPATPLRNKQPSTATKKLTLSRSTNPLKKDKDSKLTKIN